LGRVNSKKGAGAKGRKGWETPTEVKSKGKQVGRSRACRGLRPRHRFWSGVRNLWADVGKS